MAQTRRPRLGRVGAEAGVVLLAPRLLLGEDGMPGAPWATPASSRVLAADHLARARETRAC